MVSSTSHRAWHDPRRERALWTGVLAGPIVFLVLLQTNYVLAYVACETRQTWFLHLATAAAVLLVAAAAQAGRFLLAGNVDAARTRD